jgi:hypothetical protein
MQENNDLMKELFETSVKKAVQSTPLLTEESPEGYFGKEEFKKYLISWKGTWQLRDIKTFFDMMSQNRWLTDLPESQAQDGVDGIRLRSNSGNMRINIWVPCGECRMKDLITDFSNKKVRGTDDFNTLVSKLN